MTGPQADRSTGDGVLGDATGVGALLAGAMLDGNKLGSVLADAATEGGDAGTLEIDALAAGWCRPEQADNSRHAATASASQRRIDIPHCLAISLDGGWPAARADGGVARAASGRRGSGRSD